MAVEELKQFEELLVDYGNACFDCGAFDDEHLTQEETIAGYKPLNAEAKRLKAAVLEAWNKRTQ